MRVGYFFLELGDKELTNRGDSSLAERWHPLQREFGENALGNVTGSLGTVKLEEKVESLPEPGFADTGTAEEQLTAVGVPHLGESLQCISEEGGRRVASGLTLSFVFEALLLEMELVLLLLVPAFEVAEEVLVKAPN